MVVVSPLAASEYVHKNNEWMNELIDSGVWVICFVGDKLLLFATRRPRGRCLSVLVDESCLVLVKGEQVGPLVSKCRICFVGPG